MSHARGSRGYAQAAVKDAPHWALRSINRARSARGLSLLTGGRDDKDCHESQRNYNRYLRAKREHELLVDHPTWSVSRIEATLKVEFGS